MNTTDLALPAGITAEDIENIDTEKLRKKMVQGVYLLEMFLFSQAAHESARVQGTRTVINSLQDSLFDEDRMAMSPLDGGYTTGQKIELYKAASRNLEQGLRFMQDLHKNVASGMEAVKNLEREAIQEAPVEKTPKNKKAVKEARKAIAAMIREKTNS